jgi:putative oxidoreductase
MKIVTLIARILLGLAFLVFGLNGFLDFIPHGPMPAGTAGQFAGALMATHYMHCISGLEVIAAVLLLVNRYVPLGLVLLGPIIVNILFFHIFMAPSAIGPGLLVTVLWFIVFASVRQAFAGIFQAKA